MNDPIKLKTVLPNDPVSPLLGYFPKENKNMNSKRHIYPYVHCGIIHNSQDMDVN